MMSKAKTLCRNNELFLQVFLLIVVSYLLTRYLYRVFPEEDLYHNSTIFYNLYKYSSLKLMILMLFPIVLYRLEWKDIFEKRFTVLKYFVFFIFFIYAWRVITLDYNLYFNQPYHLDRITLCVLLILAIRFPLAFIYFILLSLLFFYQVTYPSSELVFPRAYVYTKPLIEILVLFIAFIFIKSIYKKISVLAFFMVVICFHASNYFIPGLGKILLSEHYFDWIWINDLGNIFIAKYSQGWLASLVPLETMQVFVGWISSITIPMQIFAFLIQTIVLFVFFNKRLAISLFVSFELLHLGIFLLSGIFFWKWILLNLAIIYVIRNLNSKDIQQIFNYKSMLWTMPFIILGYGVFHSYWLAWYDTPLNNFNKIYAITEDGKRYKVDVNLFAPYDRVFYRRTLNSFINKPLKSEWDTRSQDLMMELMKLSNQNDKDLMLKDINRFEKKYGVNEFNKLQQDKVIAFIQIFFRNLNAYKSSEFLWKDFSPLRDMYMSFDWDNLLNEPSKIKKVEIIFYKQFYNHEKNRLMFLEEKNICSIEI